MTNDTQKFHSINFPFSLRFISLRQDIARDVRETKVHYSPSEKDGVFVVEVARGADSTPGMTKPHIPLAVAEEDLHSVDCQPQLNLHSDNMRRATTDNGQRVIGIDDFEVAGSSGSNGHGSNGNEEVLVHQPPNGFCTDDDVLMVDEDGAVSMSSPKLTNGNGMPTNSQLSNTNTGLSQSDLSLSSSAGSNQDYCYGKRDAYTIDEKGYPSPRFSAIDTQHMNSHALDANGMNCEIVEVEISNGDDGDDRGNDSKPIIMAAVYKSDSNPVQIGNCEMESEVLNETKEIVADVDIGNDRNGDDDEAEIAPEAIPAPIQFETNDNNQKVIQVVETIPTNGVTTPKTNGKCHMLNENDVNENDVLPLNGDGSGGDESNEFDSLMNLPAPPPTCDEYKHMSEFTSLENGNMDSLPPQPPEVATGAPLTMES